jgi:dolichol-phosphate mannosyltransferase
VKVGQECFEMKIAVVVPTYNERENIALLLDSLWTILSPLSCQLNFVVVDDESPDGTAAVVLERQRMNPRIHLLSAPRAGLGAAYVRGLDYALSHFTPDVAIQMDADFSHSPHDIPRLLNAIKAGADLAIGSRYLGGNRTPKEWGWNRRILSWGGNLTARYWLRLAPITDCTAGFRAWRTETLRLIRYETLTAQGYAFLVAMLQRAVSKGARIIEIPVEFPDRIHGTSKLGWTDIIEFACWTTTNFSSSKQGS